MEEEYKKKYEEALERCKKEFNFNNPSYSHEEIKQRLERVFPELKESEDNIFKELFYNLIISNDCTPSSKEIFSIYGKTKEDCFAWLEKQGNISPTEDELEALRIAAYEPTKNWNEKLQSLYGKLANCEQCGHIKINHPNKVESKFKVGDWIVTPDNEVNQIEKVTYGNYWSTDETLEVREVDLDALGVLAKHLIACDANGVIPKYSDRELDILEVLANEAQKEE